MIGVQLDQPIKTYHGWAYLDSGRGNVRIGWGETGKETGARGILVRNRPLSRSLADLLIAHCVIEVLR